MHNDFRVSVAMSLMRALLGEITPNIRAVLVRPQEQDSFSIEVYVDGDVSEEDEEMASCVGTEVIADFPSNFDISQRVIRLDSPIKVPVGDGILVYLRKEEARNETHASQ